MRGIARTLEEHEDCDEPDELDEEGQSLPNLTDFNERREACDTWCLGDVQAIRLQIRLSSSFNQLFPGLQIKMRMSLPKRRSNLSIPRPL